MYLVFHRTTCYHWPSIEVAFFLIFVYFQIWWVLFILSVRLSFPPKNLPPSSCGFLSIRSEREWRLNELLLTEKEICSITPPQRSFSAASAAQSFEIIHSEYFQPFEDTKNAFPFSHTSICNTLTHTETYTYTHKDSQSSHRNRGGDKSWVFVSVFVVMFSTGVLQKCSSPPPWHYNTPPPPLCNSTNIAISPNRDTLSGGLCCHL